MSARNIPILQPISQESIDTLKAGVARLEQLIATEWPDSKAPGWWGDDHRDAILRVNVDRAALVADEIRRKQREE